MTKNSITIFTDGASRGNPGPGGWGAVVAMPAEGRTIELGGRESNTTNNRMEITAALNALLHIRHLNDDVIVHTDSSYLIQGITEWVKGWIKNGWTTSTKENVVNRDLWELLTAVIDDRQHAGSTVSWKRVSGHAGVPGNERCDEIATAYADEKEIELYNGSLEEYPIDLLSSLPTKEKKNSKARSKAKAYSYLSLVDGELQKHATWAECEARVKGVKGAKYKKALSAADEEAILKEWNVA